MALSNFMEYARIKYFQKLVSLLCCLLLSVVSVKELMHEAPKVGSLVLA